MISFCAKCNRTVLEPLPELRELLVELGREEGEMDVFHIPTELSKVNDILSELAEYNNTLVKELPDLLEKTVPVLPIELRRIIVVYVVLT